MTISGLYVTIIMTSPKQLNRWNMKQRCLLVECPRELKANLWEYILMICRDSRTQNPKNLRTLLFRLLGPTTILYKAFGLF